MSAAADTPIRAARMVLGMVQTNTWILYRTDGQTTDGKTAAVIIDPAGDGEMIYERLAEKGFIADSILLTHGHFDHIEGIAGLKKAAERDGRQLAVSCLDKERGLCEDPALNCSASMGGSGFSVAPDETFADGAVVSAAGIEMEVLATPGHTQGSCCFYIKEAGILIAGDTLFEESIGRCDLPTGSTSMLVRSVKEKLFVLPDDTLVLPGHGDETTIGHEKQYDPFVA